MAKKKIVKAKSPFKKYRGNLIGDHYDVSYLKKVKRYDHVIRKMGRYWCYHFRVLKVYEMDNTQMKPNPDKTARAPKGFKEFVEGLDGFSSWDKFADTWDLYGTNPFMIINRLLSVWKEWDYVMERVAIPINSTKEEIEARVEALTREYARKNK